MLHETGIAFWLGPPALRSLTVWPDESSIISHEPPKVSPHHMAIIETVFHWYNSRLLALTEFIDAVIPCIEKNVSSHPLLVESAVVLSVAHFEDYLRSLVGSSVEDKEAVLREHFHSHGNDKEKAIAMTCDRPTLATLAKRRLSFENDAKRLERIFLVMFGCSPWPSTATKAAIKDLVLVRNAIVHSGSADVGIDEAGPYVRQLSREDLFRSHSYGEFRVYHMEHLAVLEFLGDAAFPAIESHVKHMKTQLRLTAN